MMGYLLMGGGRGVPVDFIVVYVSCRCVFLLVSGVPGLISVRPLCLANERTGFCLLADGRLFSFQSPLYFFLLRVLLVAKRPDFLHHSLTERRFFDQSDLAMD